MSQLKTIHLYGKLADEYGSAFELDVATPAEAIRALAANFPTFYKTLYGGEYRVMRGPPEEDFALNEDQLTLGLGRVSDLHIIPMPAGSKKSGIIKVILGVALIAISIFVPPAGIAAGGTLAAGFAGEIALGVTYGAVAALGASLVLAGAAQLLSPAPKADYGGREKPDERASFFFNGPVNTVEQGGPVPIVVGRMEVGSVLVSAGLVISRI